MKTSIKSLSRMAIALIVAAVSLLNPSALAQKAVGVYLTAGDFARHQLSYTADKKYKIRIHELSFNCPVKVSCRDSVFRLNKNTLYGYQSSDGRVYRFFDKQTYTVINADTSIILYKVMVSGKTRYEDAVYCFYFSRNVNAPVYPLTIKDLETNFKENTRFITFLDICFKNNNELSAYDPFHNMYKINRLFELSINQK